MIAEAVADCSLVVGTTSVGNRELKHPLRDLAEAAPLLWERMKRGKVAVLFGSEKWGLSNEDLSYCHWLVRIPTREEHRSMNLGQAAAVVFYELGGRGGKGLAADFATVPRKGKPAPLTPAPTPIATTEFATMETVERIGETLLEVLVKSGYVGPRKTELAEEKLRRMLRRFSMSAADAEVFLGMVRKIAVRIEEEAKK